jgi:ribosome-binding protein aMBF1 (putative translation factor)
MIRSDREYQRTQQLVAATKEQIAATTRALQQQGMDQPAIDDLLVSLRLTCQQMEAELTWYEDAKAQRLGAYTFENIGQLLIGLRIAMGLSQRELASRLGVHESAVSRDEHHEYYGLTIERAQRILEALGASAAILPKYTTDQVA